MAKLGIVGCKQTTKELIEGLIALKFTIDFTITITPEKAQQQEVAGYMDLRPFLQAKGITCIIANKYSLKDEEDQAKIKALQPHILLVMGWQRLLPDWLLSCLIIGAFGMHGSNKPLPHGRGRSPLNWSLILNKNIFFTHLFQYKPGIDDGDVVGYQAFDITPWDDCRTLHYKNLLSMLKLCKIYLPEILANSFKKFPQKEIEPSYFPKRSANDGIIHWDCSTMDIYNLVRAVTKPFPGAFTFLEEKCGFTKIIIWEGIPFDSHLNWYHAKNGEILFVFESGMFLIKTGDTSFLVKHYEGKTIGEEQIGSILSSGTLQRKVWVNLPI